MTIMYCAEVMNATSTELTCDHGSYLKAKVKVCENTPLRAYMPVIDGVHVLCCTECDRFCVDRATMVKHLKAHRNSKQASEADSGEAIGNKQPSSTVTAPLAGKAGFPAFEDCFDACLIHWQLTSTAAAGLQPVQWTDVMNCVHCGGKLQINQHVNVHVLGEAYNFNLRAPYFKCGQCKKHKAAHSDEHLRQVEGFLRSGGGVINVHILHIGKSIYVTREAYMAVSRLSQGLSFARAGRQWEELQLDHLRLCFGHAEKALKTVESSSHVHGVATKILELYNKMADGGRAYHQAVKELKELKHIACAGGLQHAISAALNGAHILQPTPTEDAAHGIGNTDTCKGRRKRACPSEYTAAAILRFNHDLQFHQMFVVQQKLIRQMPCVAFSISWDHTFKYALSTCQPNAYAPRLAYAQMQRRTCTAGVPLALRFS